MLTYNRTFISNEAQAFLDIGGFYAKDINLFDMETRKVFQKT